jgi:hypothetical protein
MINLHERLSEFSYGYGVTQEVERLLAGVGIRTVPFLPSLIQEKGVGFDVGFHGRGAALLLQFKLGQSLSRFVRSDTSHSAPTLQRPFFRFSLDTAEVDGQYETLLKAQMDGAEVYYVAPRFADWPHYVRLFEEKAVLEQSVMVTPGEIRDALVAKGSPDGHHRIIYDRTSAHVCTEPRKIRDVRPNAVAESIVKRVRAKGDSLGETIRRVYAGLENRVAIRRGRSTNTDGPKKEEGADFRVFSIAALEERMPLPLTRIERSGRLAQLRARSESEEDAIAAALGLEFWGLGIQLLFAVEQVSVEQVSGVV